MEFVKGANADYFMVIDGRHETITVNFDNIDSFRENEDTGRLELVYHLPVEAGILSRGNEGQMVKKRDEFECAENALLLKTFSGIRNKIVGTGMDMTVNAHMFNKQAASVTPTLKTKRSNTIL